MRGRVLAGWVRERAVLLVVLLSLPLACSTTLPAFARLAADADAHVCACAMARGHRTCGCPVCERHADLRSRMATLRGRCGDEAAAFGASLPPAVAPAPTLLPPVRRERSALARAVTPPPADVFLAPPTPPPRSVRS